MTNRELQETWGKWLGGMHWDVVATGTWEQPVTADASLRVVQRWLSALPGAFAAVGIQRGPHSGTHHVHLLIGGVNPLAITLLRRTWVKHGHARVERFEGGRGAIRYLVAQADEIELIGTPRPFRPRRKRRSPLRNR
jgi:hypothetical protein